MPFLRSLNRFVNLYRLTLAQFGRLALWRPVLILTAVKALALLALAGYTTPAIHGWLKPYLNFFGDLTATLGIAPNSVEPFSHYPGRYFLLPSQFEWVSLPIGIFLESLVIGLLARVYAVRLAPHDHQVKPGGLGVGQWLKLAAVWLGIYVLVSAVSYLSYDLFSDWLSGSPRRIAAFEFALFILAHILLTPFALTMPLLGIAERGRASLGFALTESLRVFGRHPILTFILVMTPALLLTYPLIWAYSPGAGLIYKLKPEITLYLLLALACANAIVALLYTGTVTRLALEERRGD